MKKCRAENSNRDVKETSLIDNLFKMVFQETEWAGAKRTFFIYLSFGLEAPTDKLIARLKEEGHVVCCPRIEDGEMIAVLHGEEFALSGYGIYEPLGEIFQGEIDFAIIPFLAVDEKGNRLGYGKGYYDRFLKNVNAKRIAYGYDFQIVSSVPCEAWDERMDCIVTDEKILRIGQQE